MIHKGHNQRRGWRERPWAAVVVVVVLGSLPAKAVAQDVTPPTCIETRGTANLSRIVVRFSEPVEAGSATDLFNYTVVENANHFHNFVSAVLAADQVSVTLTLDPRMNPDTDFEVTIQDVNDLAGNSIAPGTRISGHSFVYSRGFALQELYLGIGGERVSDLRGSPNFPGNPSQANYVNLLEGPLDRYDNYGTRISGWLVPPVSGNYNFFMSSDDGGELWLSTDDRPVSMVLIAFEPQWNDSRDWQGTTRRNAAAPENRSSTLYPGGISLTAGAQCYYELIAKEGGGLDNCAATWQLPGAPLPANGSTPIPGANLAALADPVGATINITGQPQDVSFIADPAGGGTTNVTFSVTANASTESNPDQPIFYQWYRDGSAVRGANCPNYTFAATPAYNGSRYRCVLCIPGATVRSSEVVLIVPLVVRNNNDSGEDSLRAFVASVPPGSTITFAENVRGVINLTNGELVINTNLTISGPGANLLTVERSAGAGNFRIFNIAPVGVTATISGLTIADGNTNAGNSNGGGILNNGTLKITNSVISGNTSFSNTNGGGNGGGISNYGTLTLANSVISGNTANLSNAGGILNAGTLTIINSTISGNSATGGVGGGIWNAGGTLTITNSTISGNSVSNFGLGGGIFNDGGTADITNSTISGNTAEFRGGGICKSGGVSTLRARNTIIALNTSANSPDVYGPLTSQGFNLIGNNSGATISPVESSDQIGVTASQLNLGPLQDNGGPTQTHALLSGSFAIDKGHSSGSSTDQRGFGRLVDNLAIPNASVGDGGDIGAFEFGAAAPSLKILSVTRSGNGSVVLQVAGVPNGVHRIQTSIDLSFGSFIDVAAVAADAAGRFQYQDPVAGLTNFYRIAFP